MAIREGMWRCRHCQVENLGRHKSCVGLNGEGCKKARGKVKFYLPGNAPVVTDPELLKLAASGPDYSPETEPAFRAEPTPTAAETVERLQPRRAESKRKPLQLFGRNPVDLHRIRKEVREDHLWKVKIGGLAAALLLSIGFVVWRMFFATFSVEAHIESFSWERTVEIERYQTVREQDWTLPAGGRLVGSDWRIRYYEQVLDHYENRTRQVPETVQTGTETYSCGTRDLGNGFFETQTCTRPTYETRYRTEYYQDPVYRDEPVYGTYYTYDIERWLHDRTENAEAADQDPSWPSFVLDGEDERVSGRTEKYVVDFNTVEGENIEREYPEAEWKTMKVQQRFRIDRNRIGVVQAIEHL